MGCGCCTDKGSDCGERGSCLFFPFRRFFALPAERGDCSGFDMLLVFQAVTKTKRIAQKLQDVSAKGETIQ